ARGGTSPDDSRTARVRAGGDRQREDRASQRDAPEGVLVLRTNLEVIDHGNDRVEG
ncbi:hypothetical protein THAOC_17572, partial [Thalassiosira oceanica]